MIKKILILAVCAAMLIAVFGGCKVKESDTDDSSPTPSQTPKATAEPTAKPTPEETKAPETEAPADESAPSRGKWTGDVYESEYSGIKFKLPEGWSAATDEELASLLGIAEDILGDEKAWNLEVAKLASIYDLMATEAATGNNVIIVYENLDMTIGDADISESEYLGILETQLGTVEGVTYKFEEPYEATISGQNFMAVRAQEETLGFSQYFYVRNLKGYLISITVTVMDDTDIDDILTSFQ